MVSIVGVIVPHIYLNKQSMLQILTPFPSPKGFGLVVRAQFVFCGLDTRHEFEPRNRQKLDI